MDYSWDYGDGTEPVYFGARISPSNPPDHKYMVAGTYNIKLKVSNDNWDNWDGTEQDVTVT